MANDKLHAAIAGVLLIIAAFYAQPFWTGIVAAAYGGMIIASEVSR